MPVPWLRPAEDGVELLLRITANASSTRIIGEYDGRLKIAVAAAPVQGASNRALIRFLSQELDCAPSSFSIINGAFVSKKVMHIRGVSLEQVRGILPFMAF